jgi:hypothetical protein
MDDHISGKGCQIENHLTSLTGYEVQNPWKFRKKNKRVKVESTCQ